jgi:type I restriction enzyme S subunit
MEKTKPNLRFPNFKDDWKKDIIQNLFEFKNGINKEKECFGQGLPIINFMDVYKNSYITKSNIKGLVKLEPSELERFKVKKGDVFFTRTSETIIDIGMSSTLIEEIENCVFSGFVLRARPISSVFNPVFTGYLFRTNIIRKEITTKSSMTTRALTSGTLLNQVEFYWTDNIIEQTKIASFLSTVDEKINLLKKQLTLLEQYKKGVMQKIFSREIRFKDDEGNEFPEWEEKKLRDVCKISKGVQLNKEFLTITGEYPCINGGINPSGFTNNFNTRKNTITISEGGNSCGFVNLIKVDFWCGGHCYTMLNLEQSISMDYLFQFLKYNEVNIMSLRVGSGLPNIQKKDLDCFLISQPTLQEQSKIASFLSEIDETIDKNKNQIRKMELWKKGLLQQMFV